MNRDAKFINFSEEHELDYILKNSINKIIDTISIFLFKFCY